MVDDKNARDKQADDEERRQRKRELEEARERADEPEPMDPASSERLGELDDALEAHDYPTTTDELVDAFGDREVETRRGSRTVGDVLENADDESFDSPDAVRNRIRGLIHR